MGEWMNLWCLFPMEMPHYATVDRPVPLFYFLKVGSHFVKDRKVVNQLLYRHEARTTSVPPSLSGYFWQLWRLDSHLSHGGPQWCWLPPPPQASPFSSLTKFIPEPSLLEHILAESLWAGISGAFEPPGREQVEGMLRSNSSCYFASRPPDSLWRTSRFHLSLIRQLRIS